MSTNKLVEAGRFTLIRDEDGVLLWSGGGADDKDTSYLEELTLHPRSWPVGTVVIAYEPEKIPESEQNRVFGGTVSEVEDGSA